MFTVKLKSGIRLFLLCLQNKPSDILFVKLVFISYFQEPVIDYTKNPELRKLQFHGAGPKAAIPKLEDEEGGEGTGTSNKIQNFTITVKVLC